MAPGAWPDFGISALANQIPTLRCVAVAAAATLAPGGRAGQADTLPLPAAARVKYDPAVKQRGLRVRQGRAGRAFYALIAAHSRFGRGKPRAAAGLESQTERCERTTGRGPRLLAPGCPRRGPSVERRYITRKLRFHECRHLSRQGDTPPRHLAATPPRPRVPAVLPGRRVPWVGLLC